MQRQTQGQALFSETQMTFGNWLRERRSEAGLSQRELARESGCSHSFVQKIEMGIRLPSLLIVQRLFRVLHVAAAEEHWPLSLIEHQLGAMTLAALPKPMPPSPATSMRVGYVRDSRGSPVGEFLPVITPYADMRAAEPAWAFPATTTLREKLRIEQSWPCLSAIQQYVLLRCANFDAGFSLDAALRVVHVRYAHPVKDLHALLNELVNNNWLQRSFDPTGQRPTRYSMSPEIQLWLRRIK